MCYHVRKQAAPSKKFYWRRKMLVYYCNFTVCFRPYIVTNEIKEKAKEGKKKEDGTKQISYIKLFKYSQLLDKILIIFGTICASLTGCIFPVFMMSFGDVTGVLIDYTTSYNDSLSKNETDILEDRLYSSIHDFAITSTIAGFVMIAASYLSGVCFSYSAIRQIFHIRKLFLEKTLNKDISWYDVHKTGDFATKFTENLSKIEEGIGEKVGILLYFESTFVVGVIVALVLGWKLALVCLAAFPLSTIIMNLISWLSTKFAKQELEAYSAAGAIAEEVFSSIRTVVSFDGQETEFERYNKYLEFTKNNNIRKSLFTALSNGALWFFIYAACGISFWYGVILVFEDKYLPEDQKVYTPGNMVAIFLCTINANWNYGCGAPYFEIFGTACGAATEVFKILEEEPTINLSKKSGAKLREIRGNITFEKVDFHYPSRPDVQILRGFSLDIKAGESVALVGSSGCGKSTCIQLIQRFYDTISGAVYIDDEDIVDLNLSWLRSKIGVVGQEPVLFATTISNNIKYGNLSANQEDVQRAAKRANAHEFIQKLPHGYDTVIGERGASLSGGQKQRIAIARALIREPKILLLDEATSALDTTSEAEVQAALDKITGECTTIIVAHRLSTIRNANRIVVVSQGEVIEQGSHNQLIEAKGAYYNLVQSHGLQDNDDVLSELDESEFQNTVNSNEELKEDAEDAEEIEEEEFNDEVKKKKSGPLISVLKLNRPEWFYIFLGCVTSVITGGCLPAYGVIFGDILGVLANDDDNYVRRQSNLLSLAFLILGIVSGIATFLQLYSFGVAGEKLTLRIRGLMFRSMLKQEMGWFDRKENGVGALCAKLSSECASVQGAAGIRIGTILNSFSTFIITYIIALYFEWKLSLVLLAFTPVIMLSIFFEQKFIQSSTQTNQKFLENSAKLAVEAIGNIRTVASLGVEHTFYENYVKSLLPYVENVKKQTHFRAFVMGIARSIMLFAYAVGFVYGAQLMVSEKLPYGVVIQVSQIVIAGSWSIGNAFSFSPNFQKGLSAAGRIFKLIRRDPEVKNSNNPSTINKVDGNIDYKNIHFSYPTRQNLQVLNGLDLSVLQGKTVALVGSSGCGKSTLIQLLERFYDPLSGSILLDGKNTQNLDIHNLRSHIGLVSQEPNLFDRTIAENIAYGANHRNISLNEIIEAAKSANIHNFISSLPKGYETNLGSKGTQLSGGQKQRVAIARALIRDPKVLLLDEATSALDNESEKIVQEALDNARKNRTCITIAHRLTTIQDADLICVINGGVIAEMGKHLELLEKKGLYYDFYKLQSGQK